jgi:hypothetical protein
MFRWIYHASRVIFGGWWLYSGLMHFIDPTWQPLGQEQAAIDFTLALIASGLFEWVKVIEVILGLTMLANRLMPLTILAMIPINVVIVYWNFVLEIGTVEYVFGALTIVFNAILAWPWRGHLWQLLSWNAKPAYSVFPVLPSDPRR